MPPGGRAKIENVKYTKKCLIANNRKGYSTYHIKLHTFKFPDFFYVFGIPIIAGNIPDSKL